MNSMNIKFLGAVLLLSVTFVFSCKVADAGATADDTTDTGKTMHTVTIVLNGGMGVSDQPQKVEDGKMLTIGNPTKAGYVFKGWSTNNTLSNLDFTSASYAIKSDITIYAMFNKLYTVTIDPNGGTVPTLTYQREDGASLTLTELPTKTLYTFGAYKNGTTSYTLNTAFVVSGDMTLTAQWAADLAAIRDLLTGKSTTGHQWNESGGSDHNLTFKLSANNPTSLTIVYNWHLFGGDSPANSTTEIVTSDDPKYLVKFVPSLKTFISNSSSFYLSSISESNLEVVFNGTSTASFTKQ